ncbi:hypothetical protein C0991_010544, partial [Blastosporella zonata]
CPMSTSANRFFSAHTKPTVSVPSQPSPILTGTTNPSLHNQGNHNGSNPASGAIISGADHMLTLFEEEKTRIEAQHAERIRCLEWQFEQYLKYAELKHQQLLEQIRALEAELALKSKGATEGKE